MNSQTFFATSVALLAVAAPALAQTHEPRFRLQLGVARPTTSVDKQFLGTSPIVGGLSYDLGKLNKDETLKWGLYSDMASRERTLATATPGTTTSQQAYVGFGLQVRKDAESGLFFGAGVGSYSALSSTVNELGNRTSTTTIAESGIGGRVFVGKTFAKKFFVEGGYTFVPSKTLDGTRAEGNRFSLGVGIKF